MLERDYQQRIIDLAHLHGWQVAHFRPAQNNRGQWRTPVAADGAGFPDLVLARDGDVLFWEIKTDKGRTTTEQRQWLLALNNTTNRAAIIRPADWNYVQDRLKR